MALLHGITVESITVDLPASGEASGATMRFGLVGYETTGVPHRVTASIPSADFPTNQTTFMSALWTGAFLNAYDVVGHSIPDDAEWSPWPIV